MSSTAGSVAILFASPALFLGIILSASAQNSPSGPGAAHKNSFHEAGDPVSMTEPFQPGRQIPVWRNGGFIQNLGAPGSELSIWDRSGNRRDVQVKIPGAVVVRLDDYDLDLSENLYVSGMADDADGRSPHFLARIGRKDGRTAIVRTGTFAAAHVCVTPTGDVWALGHRSVKPANGRPYPMLRLYSFEKGELRGFLMNTAVPNAAKSGFRTPFGIGHSVKSNDDTYWVTAQIASCTAGSVDVFSPETNEWIHLNLADGELLRIAIDSSAIRFVRGKTQQSFAFLPGESMRDGYGTAYLLSVDRSSESAKRQLFMLRIQKEGAVWKDVSMRAGLEGENVLSAIYGVEGRSLVHWTGDGQLHFSVPDPDELEGR